MSLGPRGEGRQPDGIVLAHTVVLTTGLGCRELIVLIIRLPAVDLLRAHCAQFHAAAIPGTSRIVSGVSVWERASTMVSDNSTD